MVFAVFLSASSFAWAQTVVNYDTTYNGTNFNGQGACLDLGTSYAGNNLWNSSLTGLLTSTGATSPVTLSLNYTGYWAGSALSPSLLGGYVYASANSTKTITLNNVPTGKTYSLYLYGINGSYASNGTTFTVGGTSQSTVNDSNGTSAYVIGDNYVVFNNLKPSGSGAITVNWQANTGVSGNTEGDFNGLQLVQHAVLTPSIMGSGNFSTSDTGTVLAQKIAALQAAGATWARVALAPNAYYNDKWGTVPSPEVCAPLINALIEHGITPYVHFEYYENTGLGYNASILDYNWTAIGTAFANYYGTSVLYYAAFNEPDMAQYNSPPGSTPIPPADYATALGNLASAIHAVVPTAKVIPGGYGQPGSFNIWTCGGYPAAIASLLSSGALDGIDLHLYWDTPYTAISTPDLSSLQGEFQHVKTACGLGDVKLYCTEFDTDTSFGDPQDAQMLLTLTWSVLACTKNNNTTPNTQIALPWSLVEQEADFGLYTQLSPWTPNSRGLVIQRVLSLTSGMTFVPGSQSYGSCIMTGTNKKLWVIQNLTNWVPVVSSNYSCTGIPSAATKLLRYGYDGLRETVNITPGTSTYSFTDIPSGETTMIQATP